MAAGQTLRFHVQASGANDACLGGIPPSYELKLIGTDGQALGSAINNPYAREGFCRLTCRAQFAMEVTVAVLNHSECMTHYLLMVGPGGK